MRALGFRRPAARLALQNRLALFISAGIVLAGLALVLFLNLALQNSLSRKPALLAMAPNAVYIKTLAYKPRVVVDAKTPERVVIYTHASAGQKTGELPKIKALAKNQTIPLPQKDGGFNVGLFQAGGVPKITSLAKSQTIPLPQPKDGEFNVGLFQTGELSKMAALAKSQTIPLPLPKDGDFNVRLFQAGDYDHLWSAEIARRLTGYSLLSVGILAVLAFFGSYLLSRKAMRPLTEMASLAGSLNATDLTPRLEQRGPEDEISQLAASFNGMLDRLQSAFHELEQFNAFASHELRNALAVTRTRLEVGLAATDHREALQDALRSTVRLSQVVDDMLALSTPLAAAQTEPVDLALAAAEAVDAYLRPGRLLELDLPEEGVPLVHGHAAWLHRAIANLLDNAFKYGPENGPVRVRVDHRQKAVVIFVADRGPGIPADALDRIWESYRRLGSQPRQSCTHDGCEASDVHGCTKAAQGSGLGLALVKHAVEAAGGKVWVESKPGEGSTFYLEVPVAV